MTVQSNGPAVIIGNPSSLFPRSLAAYWRSLGMDVVIVTRRVWQGESTLPDGTRILASEGQESTDLATRLTLASTLLTKLEEELDPFFNERARKAMAGWGEGNYRPSIVPPLVDGMGISHCVRKLRPRFVFGQEAFAYGLATALCRGVPRILMPWGGDIYLFAETSPIAFALTKYVLHQVDLVVPTSLIATRHICQRFDLPKSKIRTLSWGVDTKRFQPAAPEARRVICRRFGIDPSATILMNIRRFRPAWGSAITLEAFIRLADEEPTCHFVLLGGTGSEEFVREARRQLGVRQLAHRFTLFDGDISLSDCADLMAVSDVAISLMRAQDMRSASILQAAASGSALVLSDQPEYREMERLSFRASFVDPDDADAVVSAARAYLRNRALRDEVARENRAFVLEHEDYDCQMAKLLEIIDGVTQSCSTGNEGTCQKSPGPGSEALLCR